MTSALLVPSRLISFRRRALEWSVIGIVSLPWLSHCLPELTIQMEPTVNAVASWTPPFFLILWTLGVLIGLTKGVKQYQQLIHLKEQARPLEPGELDCIRQMLQLDEHTISSRILVNQRINTPMALPSSPGSVLLPEKWRHWSPTLQKAVLKHEWHHVQQHDALLGCFMRVFLILFWFNPIAWLLVSSWVATCEHEADLAAISDEGPVSYANELLAFAREQSLHDSAGSHDLCVPAFTRSKLAVRIELLLAKGCCSRQDHWIGGLSIMALILGLLGCAWFGRPVTFSDQMHEEAVTRLSANAFPSDAGLSETRAWRE